MAHITYSAPSAVWPSRLLAGIGGAMKGIGRALAVSRQCESRFRQIERLQAKTDGELANLGLSRDRIVHHVFRDIYYL